MRKEAETVAYCLWIVIVVLLFCGVFLLLSGCDTKEKYRCAESHNQVSVSSAVDPKGRVRIQTSVHTVCDCWQENLAEYDKDQPCVDR